MIIGVIAIILKVNSLRRPNGLNKVVPMEYIKKTIKIALKDQIILARIV